ncbi:hypothetical protein [Bradyrhizobium elkanii]|uniref:hypothetical protein n=1 Tax=Bradyrhizobium elkanii TaxID=29448 RepID=UPI001FD87ED4|nr:hypothetical protein [Bradyrhizobium elkanii]
MSTTNVVDTARLNLLLNELRLPAIKGAVAAICRAVPIRKAGRRRALLATICRARDR